MAVTFTDPSVFKGIASGASWADPTMDPTEIDWEQRLRHAAIPFQVIDGRPVNPGAPTGIRYGRNELGHWGEQRCADAIVTAATTDGQRWLLLVERSDGHGWALPGGYVDPGETAVFAAARELEEETGLTVDGVTPVPGAPLRADDPRQSDEAWMVTTPVAFPLGVRESLPLVSGTDDAARAEWVRALTWGDLVADLDSRFGGTVFAAHRTMVHEVTDGMWS